LWGSRRDEFGDTLLTLCLQSTDFSASKMTSPKQFRQLRSMQPSRPSSEAYAQMGRMLAASAKEIVQAGSGESLKSGAPKPASSSIRK
jgi:hypothetical protein